VIVADDEVVRKLSSRFSFTVAALSLDCVVSRHNMFSFDSYLGTGEAADPPPIVLPTFCDRPDEGLPPEGSVAPITFLSVFSSRHFGGV